MSSTAYILPIDPKNQSAHVLPELDLAKLWSSAPPTEKTPKVGATRVFFNTPDGPDNNLTTLSSLGEGFAEKKGDARREIVRKAIGSAVKEVRKFGDAVKHAVVDASLDPHAAAVAAHLAQYRFTLKTSPPSPFNPNATEPPPASIDFKPFSESREWDTGVVYANAQNLARTFMELPGNMMTPTLFTERVKSEFAGIPNVEIIVRDEAWAAEKGMRTFLSVTRGTSEPAKVLEIKYNGGAPDAQPLAFVGKGITFDSGGISLKPGAAMKLMRGDMGGAAVVASSALAIAQLKLPVNLVVVIPLTENMPGPSATKPGDIIYAINGKSVEVDNTDAEGRLVLADAIYYTSVAYKPHTLIDVATLTGAMDVAVGEIYTGVFTSSDELWNQLNIAGEAEYDRFWRMPLDEDYGPQIYSSNADLCNTGGRPAGCCTAALFLKAFAEGSEAKDGQQARMKWAHMDTGGSMDLTRPTPYMEKGMSGRPTRALIEYVRQLTTSDQ